MWVWKITKIMEKISKKNSLGGKYFIPSYLNGSFKNSLYYLNSLYHFQYKTWLKLFFHFSIFFILIFDDFIPPDVYKRIVIIKSKK